MKKTVTDIRVRYAETDQMGVVHHANYYVYFEAAREDLIKEIGIRYSEMEDMGIMMPLVETQCRYIKGAKYDEELVVETSVDALTPVKIVINYNVKDKNSGEFIAKGKTTQAFVDKNSFKIINMKKENLEIWTKIEKLILT